MHSIDDNQTYSVIQAIIAVVWMLWVLFVGIMEATLRLLLNWLRLIPRLSDLPQIHLLIGEDAWSVTFLRYKRQ